MRFRDIATFVLHCATFSHPTSSFPKISPCSTGSRWMTFGLRAYEERRCWANCSRNWFPSFSTYVVMIHQRYRRTDRQTTGDSKTALCTILQCIAR